jgi:hypothetical protein
MTLDFSNDIILLAALGPAVLEEEEEEEAAALFEYDFLFLSFRSRNREYGQMDPSH